MEHYIIEPQRKTPVAGATQVLVAGGGMAGIAAALAAARHGKQVTLLERQFALGGMATLGLITPSIIVILIIAGFLQKFRHSRTVEAVFSGLRPASTALIAAAGLSVAFSVFTVADNLSPDSFPAISWPSLLLAVAVFVGMKWTPLKKLHPIVFILASAVAGILLQL